MTHDNGTNTFLSNQQIYDAIHGPNKLLTDDEKPIEGKTVYSASDRFTLRLKVASEKEKVLYPNPMDDTEQEYEPNSDNQILILPFNGSVELKNALQALLIEEFGREIFTQTGAIEVTEDKFSQLTTQLATEMKKHTPVPDLYNSTYSGQHNGNKHLVLDLETHKTTGNTTISNAQNAEDNAPALIAVRQNFQKKNIYIIEVEENTTVTVEGAEETNGQTYNKNFVVCVEKLEEGKTEVAPWTVTAMSMDYAIETLALEKPDDLTTGRDDLTFFEPSTVGKEGRLDASKIASNKLNSDIKTKAAAPPDRNIIDINQSPLEIGASTSF